MLLEWALVFGKWAVILTQLVVMSAFLYRFALDRELTDLRKAIAQNVAIIKSYEQIEREWVIAQKQVAKIKEAVASQELILATIVEVQKITPPEVWYDRVTFSPKSMSMTAYSASLSGFGQYLRSVQGNPSFSSVRIGKIESSSSRGAQMQFDISMNLAGAKEEKKK